MDGAAPKIGDAPVVLHDLISLIVWLRSGPKATLGRNARMGEVVWWAP